MHTLQTPTLKIRCMTADVLAALCMLSPSAHQIVLDGLSDCKTVFGETFRFEHLIKSMEAFRPEDSPDAASDSPELLVMWDWRISVMGLLNAVATSAEDIETRCDLRGEMCRRGMHQAIEVRTAKLLIATKLITQALEAAYPPDEFLIQANMYHEEREEDLAELQQWSFGLLTGRNRSLGVIGEGEDAEHLLSFSNSNSDNSLSTSVGEVDRLRHQVHDLRYEALQRETSDLQQRVRPPSSLTLSWW